MIHLLLPIYVLLYLLQTQTCHAQDEALQSDLERFKSTRRVLATVVFAGDSVVLSQAEKQALRSRINQIREARKGAHVLRLEGFNGATDKQDADCSLAMVRAKTVADHLRLTYGIDAQIYLTGFDRNQNNGTTEPARVEIASYQDLLKIRSAPVAESVTSFP